MIVIAAAEVGVGLAIILQLFRLKASVVVDYVPLGHASDEIADSDELDVPLGEARR